MKLTVPETSPLKAMFLAVSNVVAVLALPTNAAVIVLAVKLPLASRATIVLAVLALVAFELTVIEPVELSMLRPVPLTAALVTPLLVNVTVSVPASVVIVKPVLPANVTVSFSSPAVTVL